MTTIEECGLDGVNIPDAIDVPEFRVAWQAYLARQREIGTRLYPMRKRLLLARLEKLGVTRATETIRGMTG